MHDLISKYNKKYFLLCAAYFLIVFLVIGKIPLIFAFFVFISSYGVFIWVEGKIAKRLVRDIEMEVRIASKV